MVYAKVTGISVTDAMERRFGQIKHVQGNSSNRYVNHTAAMSLIRKDSFACRYAEKRKWMVR
jgi:hypothetical protein